MLVRRNATFGNCSCRACLAPVHIRAPLMSTPMKLTLGNILASPTAYSPLPHPSSSTMGLSLWKNISLHRPFMSNGTFSMAEKGYWKTLLNVSISANFCSFPFPIICFQVGVYNTLTFPPLFNDNRCPSVLVLYGAILYAP